MSPWEGKSLSQKEKRKRLIQRNPQQEHSNFPQLPENKTCILFFNKMYLWVSTSASLTAVQLYEKFRLFSLTFSILNIFEANHLPSGVLEERNNSAEDWVQQRYPHESMSHSEILSGLRHVDCVSSSLSGGHFQSEGFTEVQTSP